MSRNVFKQYKELKKSKKDEDHPGRPWTSIYEQNVKKKRVLADRQITIKIFCLWCCIPLWPVDIISRKTKKKWYLDKAALHVDSLWPFCIKRDAYHSVTIVFIWLWYYVTSGFTINLKELSADTVLDRLRSNWIRFRVYSFRWREMISDIHPAPVTGEPGDCSASDFKGSQSNFIKVVIFYISA